jgi:5-methyltetrahydropteroyltriglutamate--homocysteine methyltransferase
MSIKLLPTEPVGSIPRPESLQKLYTSNADKDLLRQEIDLATKETIRKFEETNSPIITDGEQSKSSFFSYVFEGLTNLGSGPLAIGFVDGHQRQLPLLLSGPFRYGQYADKFVTQAKKLTDKPIKVSVMSVNAITLIYPADGIAGYSRDEFIKDLVSEAAKEITLCFKAGAETVQIDWTEGRLSFKLDPSGGFLNEGIKLINEVIAQVPKEYHSRIGLHTCPGGDHDSTHSADVPYENLLSRIFEVNAGRFYLQLASEANYEAGLKEIGKNLRKGQIAYIGVIDPLTDQVETAEQVRDRILLAAKYIPLDQLGSTDDCGFSPFTDDLSTSRDTAFNKIKARIDGNALASEILLK